MRRHSEAAKAESRPISRVGVGLLLLLTAAIGAPVEFETRRPTVPASLAQAVQGNSQISDADASGSKTRQPEAFDYRVDTGDRVSIVVYQEPDLSVTSVRVNANGTIPYPLLGDLHISGLTSQQVHDLVKEGLLDGYLKNPDVTVSIDSYRLYFIKGQVNRPGGYSFVDGLTIAKAVALAGGYTVRASESSINLVRESDPNQSLESVGPNMTILPGDIITVGESFF